MTLRRALAFAVAFLALATAAGAQPATLEIPVMLPLTGPAAFIGQGQSVSLGVLERLTNAQGGIHGHPVKFAISDDQSNPALAVQFANALIGKNVPLMIGPAFTAECLAVAPLIKNGPVQYCLSPGITPAPGSYVYSAGIAGNDYPILFLRYFAAKHINRIAIITTTDASGQNLEAAFNRAIVLPQFKTMQVVAREHLNVADLSADAQLSRIKAAAPDVVIEWTASTAFGTLLRGTQEVGLNVPIAGGSGNMTYTQMAQYAAFLPKVLLFPAVSSSTLGGVGPGPIRDAQTVYFNAFRAAGVRPDFQSAMVWDPAMIVLAAYRALGPDAKADAIQDYLQHLHSWVGINGVYDFRDGSQRGIGVGVGVIAQWDPAKKISSRSANLAAIRNDRSGRLSAPPMPVVMVEGRAVEYVRAGAGSTVVLSSPTWWPLDAWRLSGIGELSPAHDVVAFNHRGIGESAADPGPYSVWSMARDMLDLADALGIERFHVVGYANGAAVGLIAAREQTERIRSLTLVAPSGGFPSTAPAPRDGVLRDVKAIGFENHIRQYPKTSAHPSFLRDQPARAAALSDALWLHQGSLDNFLEHADARRGYDALELAAGVDVPAVVLIGADDGEVRGARSPIDSARALATTLPNARLMLLDGVGHMPFWESPGTWDAVLDFLADVDRIA